MAISVTGTPAAWSNTTLSQSYTVAAGSDILVVGANNCPGYITNWDGATYGGVAMTKACQDANPGTAMFYLRRPTAGTATLAVTYTGGYCRGMFAITFGGGCAGLPTNCPTDTGVRTLTATGVPTGFYFIASAQNGTAESNSSFSAGTAIQDYYFDPGSGNRGNLLGAYVQESGGSATITYINGGTTYQSISGLVIAPTLAGNQAIWVAMRRMKHFLHDLREGLTPPDLLQQRYRDLFKTPGLMPI